jgi:hypothetical protein
MFRKELADVLKQTGWFLAVAALLPLPLILFKWAPGPYLAVFIPALQPGLFFWSLFLGASLFGRERGQRAMEYALSLPHSRLGLLVRLTCPRLLVLTALFLIAWAVSGIAKTEMAIFPYPPLALFFCLPIFLVSLSLSVLIENFIVLCFASLLGWYAAGIAIFRLLWGFGVRSVDLRLPGLFVLPRPDVAAYRADFTLPLILLQLILPVVPFLAALFLSLGRFDVRRSARFKRRYGLAFAASLALCALAAFGGRAAADALAQKDFYLTRDLKLVEWKYASKSARIRGEGSSFKIRVDPPGLAFRWDDGSSLYVQDYDGNLNRIELATGKTEALYHFDRKQTSFWGQWTYGSIIAFFENGSRPNEIQLVTLDKGTKKTDRYVFSHEAFRPGAPTLVGTDVRDGKRFWICLIRRKAVLMSLRLWEDGRAEEILVKGRLETVNSPHLINGLLFFSGREPTIVLQDNGRSFELKKEYPVEETFHAREGFYFQKPLDAPAVPFIYGKRGPKLARMDMETLEIEDVGDWWKSTDDWGYVHRWGGQTYFVGGSRSRKNIDVLDLNDGQMRLIRSFPGIDTERRDSRFDIYESGIVITQGKHVGVYAFPDLRELKFKGVR